MAAGAWRGMPAVGTAVLLLAAGPVAAATIYGSLSENQQPAGNRQIELLCPGQGSLPPVTTDARGSYRITVNAVGKCEVRVDTLTAPVILSVNPAQYNFDIRSVGGRRALIQR